MADYVVASRFTSTQTNQNPGLPTSTMLQTQYSVTQYSVTLADPLFVGPGYRSYKIKMPVLPEGAAETVAMQSDVLAVLDHVELLAKQVQELRKELSDLKTQVEYMPGGPGYEEAKAHFETGQAAQLARPPAKEE